MYLVVGNYTKIAVVTDKLYLIRVNRFLFFVSIFFSHIKFSRLYLKIMLLSICELCENGHIFAVDFMDVNAIYGFTVN
jgi:hypothetical protein